MNAGKRRKYGSFGNQGHLKKRQKKHLHDEPPEETGREFYRKVKDEDLPSQEAQSMGSEDTSDEENEQEASDYQQLVSTLGGESSSSSSSDEETETEENEEEADDDENEENENDDEAGIEVQDDSDIDDIDNDDINSRTESENEETDSDHLGNDEDYRTDDQSEEEAEENNVFLKENDPFSIHFEKDIPDEMADKLGETSAWTTQQFHVSHLGRCSTVFPKDKRQNINTSIEKDIKKLHVKRKLLAQTSATNKKCAKVATRSSGLLSTLQMNFFNIINRYQDLCYPDRNKSNSEEIRLVYCLHALNHVLKTRSRVMAHNSKIKSKREEVPDEYRDQGLTRPKVLMVLPFRESALRVVRMLSMLLMSEDESNVEFKKRFYKEYDEEEKSDPPENKPEDFVETFAGNIDDHFRIGIGVTKKSLKLYSNFYASDIILASPLGLRTIIGAEGEEKRDHDFLSSIEILIFDQTDIFLMQNWDHINHLMTHMHLQPKESHGVDFSRVRMWTLNGWSKFYRQTLIFSSIAVPEINALFNKHCHNYAGKFQVAKLYNRGSICQIHIQLPQVFHRISVGSFAEVAEARFEYFKSKVLPQYKDELMSSTMIFIPSYFDFVRIRNFFKAQELDFVHISEYSTEKQISKARNGFNKRGKHFMLFTERFHFYKRLKIRGIKHIVFYDLPYYSHLYSEMCNFIPDPQRSSKAVNWDITALYTKYDAQKLAAIVGNERAAQMINAQKSVHMFVTGDT